MQLNKSVAGADLNFAVLSDVHITHRGQGIEKFTEAVMQLFAMDPKPDLLVLDGDVAYQIDRAGAGSADQLYDEPYNMIMAVLRRYVKDTPVLYVMGNHEYGQNRHEDFMVKAAQELFKEKTGYPMHTHNVYGGYHFIGMSCDSYNCTFTPEVEAWGKAEIEKALADGTEKPVFVVFHGPVRDTVGDPTPLQSPEFEAFLRKNPRIVAVVGHLHTPVNDPRTIYQEKGGFTTIHTPLCAVGNCEIYGCENHCRSGGPVSQGLWYEVRGTQVQVHKLDFMQGKEVDVPWTLDTAALCHGEGYHYTDDRARIANTPAFPKGATLVLSAAAGRVSLRCPLAACAPAGASQDGFCGFYRVCFESDDGKRGTMLLSDDFYLLRPQTDFCATLPGTFSGERVTVTVTPVHIFGKEGRPLHRSVRVR